MQERGEEVHDVRLGFEREMDGVCICMYPAVSMAVYSCRQGAEAHTGLYGEKRVM